VKRNRIVHGLDPRPRKRRLTKAVRAQMTRSVVASPYCRSFCFDDPGPGVYQNRP
jgi:hypothetical protein